MSDNWIALLAAIINPELSADKALLRVGLGQTQTKKYKHGCGRRHIDISIEDIEEMIRMREQNIFYKDIGKHFGISDKTVYAKIKRYKQKTNAA